MEVTIMFWETLDDHRIELLKKIVNKVDIIWLVGQPYLFN